MLLPRSPVPLALALTLAPSAALPGQGASPGLAVVSVHQGAPASDAFSAIRYLGSGRIIAGKRSSQPGNRFLFSKDHGTTWQVIGCPGSTGAHTYFFGQHGMTLLAGTGDTGNACLMRSDDGGLRWQVTLTAAQLRALTGSASVLAVFGPVHLGAGRWLVNLKTLDTRTKLIASSDNGRSWSVPPAQPGQSVTAWARQMVLTGDGVLLWPSCLTDRMYRSLDLGGSWTATTVSGAVLFQPLCDAGGGIYLCGDATPLASSPIALHRSLDRGITWQPVVSVNLQRPTATYWRDVIRVGGSLFASACCVEASSSERHMQLFRSLDDGATWHSLGNPWHGPFGGMQAIYQMCATEHGAVFAACQPDSNILRWHADDGR